jgi:tetratricopeptide (TPR) repeat protein
VANFPNVFDEVAGIDLLGPAGELAAEHGQIDMAVIYLSEAVRFDVDDNASRYRLANLLARDNQPRPLLEHAQRLLQAVPGNTLALALRSYAHLLLRDPAHAKQDLLDALAKDPDNPQILTLLGRLYVYTTREWDKGWAVADHLIRVRPDMPEGWRLRVSIQLHQPRPGLDDTIHYFLAHFGNDPQQRSAANEMHRILDAEAKGGEKALAPFRG